MSMEADEALRRALEAFGLEPLRAPQPVDDSVLNLNYRVETTGGAVFLRWHRAGRPLERLQREQAGAVWAGSHGLPVAQPLPTPGGDSIIEIDGRFWSAYRWIDGSTYRRGSITPEQASNLGQVHGRCQVALRDYPLAATLPKNTELTWSAEASLAVLDSIRAEVQRRGTDQEQRWLTKQTELLRSGVARGSEEFGWLPLAVTHGDFHERNVMFTDSGELAAVVDWERFCLQPPAFEVLRAVSFMLILEEEPLRAYLEGFREYAVLEERTIAPAVDAWWQSSMHNTWAFRDTFRDGSTTSRQFLPEEERRSLQFNDPDFRDWLSATIVRYAT